MKINSPQFNLMQKACIKASKVLIRDFGEVEKFPSLEWKVPIRFCQEEKQTKQILGINKWNNLIQ